MKLLEMPKERNYCIGKSQMTMIVFAISGRSKFATSKEAIEVVVGELRNFAREELAHQSAVRGSARKKLHMHLSGLVMMQPHYMEQAMQDHMFAMWQPMSLKEQMECLLGGLKDGMPTRVIMPDEGQEADMSWMNAQEPVVGLKYGKGYKLRCCPRSLMAA